MSADAAAAPGRKWWNGPVQGLQKVGRSLQLPVAVLPAAGLLVSLGNLFDSYLHGAFWDKTSKVLLNGGNAILDGTVGLPCCSASVSRSASPGSPTARRPSPRSSASSCTGASWGRSRWPGR